MSKGIGMEPAASITEMVFTVPDEELDYFDKDLKGSSTAKQASVKQGDQHPVSLDCLSPKPGHFYIIT